MRYMVIFVIVSFSLVPAASGTTHLVCPDGSGDFTTIQDAIDAALTGDTIQLCPYGGNPYTGAGNVHLNFLGKNLTLQPQLDPGRSYIDCQNTATAFVFINGENSTAVVERLTIQNGLTNSASYPGGAVHCGGGSSPTFLDCGFEYNNSDYSGGAVGCTGGSNPEFIDCWFLQNSAVGNGGAIYCEDSSPVITDCNFSLNSAPSTVSGGSGGAIFGDLSSPVVTNCDFNVNSAGNHGAGVYASGGSPVLRRCTFLQNDAVDKGGGMYCSSSCNATIDTCTFQENVADYGGGISCNASTVTIDSSTISLNQAGTDGGGVYCESNSTLNISKSRFNGNTAISGDGGGMKCQYSSPPTLNDCIFSGNYATSGHGGGIRLDDSASIVNKCTFSANHASSGGGVSSRGGALDSCTFSSNEADYGGGLFCNAAASVTSGTFSDNEAYEEGGGLYFNSPTPPFPTITDCEFNGNSAGTAPYTGRGGAIYCNRGSPTFSYLKLNNNSASIGGGMFCRNSACVIDSCVFFSNEADHDGGAIYCMINATPSITRCQFTQNWAERNGGGTYFNSFSNATLDSCIFDTNTADASGGGVYCYDHSQPNFIDCLFNNNSAVVRGGGMYVRYNSDAILTGCQFNQNSTDGDGGGMFLDESSEPSLTDCMFSNNSALSGGGMYCRDQAVPTLDSCTFDTNTAGGNGGAVSCDNSLTKSLEANYSSFYRNSTGEKGGGLYFFDSNATLTNCTFYGNLADSCGAVIAARVGSSIIVESTIIAFSPAGEAVCCDGLSAATLTCSNVYGNDGGDWVDCIAGQEHVNGNFSADPMFCDTTSNDFTLSDNSPCLHNTCCVQVGAHGEGCSTEYAITFTRQVDRGSPISLDQADPRVPARGDTTWLASYTFGSEPDCTAEGWASVNLSCRGDFAGLYPGLGLVQEDFCRVNLSCMWAFINGSTENYACGGFPEQLAVPGQDEFDRFIWNEIWSPKIAWNQPPATGTSAELVFDVYRDLPLYNLVFYVWHIRSWIGGEPGPWRDREIVYFGGGKDWLTAIQQVGDLVEPGADSIQVALGVKDLADVWAGWFGYGDCHSHAPLFGNVEVYRISTTGPVWSVRDVDLFQDTFPENGTSVGTGRIDAAIDINPPWDPSILPQDWASVMCGDPEFGIRTPEPNSGSGGAVYMYMYRDPPNPMPKDEIVEDSFRWPVVDSVNCEGHKWYVFRMDTCFADPTGLRKDPVPDTWCIDISDHYFTNGDTIWFFFGAENSVNEWTYYSEFTGTVPTIEEACADPMEVQILPSNNVEGDILYVDYFDGRGAQPLFDSAFKTIGIYDLVDRFDKRGPSSFVGNGIANHATLDQLIENYRKIIWNSGDLSTGTVGDGTVEKANDYALLGLFLHFHPNTSGAGIYFSGDDLAEELAMMASASSLNFRNTYIPYNLITGRHTNFHITTRLGVGESAGPTSAGIFIDPPYPGVDTIVVHGGCPIINDVDVIEPTGISTLEMTYNGEYENPAVIATAQLNDFLNPIAVVLSGFSFHNIRDYKPRGVPDRADHLRDILQYLGNLIEPIVGVGSTPQFTYGLSQNHPNPFNPSTTIKYSIKERTHVSLEIYNVAGQLVKTLVDEVKSPRIDGHMVTWDCRNKNGQIVSSGVYFYRLVTKNFTQTKKMVILK